MHNINMPPKVSPVQKGKFSEGFYPITHPWSGTVNCSLLYPVSISLYKNKHKLFYFSPFLYSKR